LGFARFWLEACLLACKDENTFERYESFYYY